MSDMIEQKTSNVKQACPECGSTNIAEILWGMPVFSKELERDLEEGRIVLGGCCISVESPEWHCNDCGFEFGTAMDDEFDIPLEFMHRRDFDWNVMDLVNDIADAISQMVDGEVSSIARMAHRVLGKKYDGDMFQLMDLVLFACAERGIYLDYHEHDGKEEGLPYNLTFIKRSSESVGPLPENARICVLHHPLRGCTTWPGMKFEDFGIDRAHVVFDGLLEEAKKRYWKCDDGSGFTIDCRQVDEGYCVIALIDGAYKKPFAALFAAYGEAATYEAPLCDAAEEWTFIVYQGNVDIDEAMKGYRKASDSEYVNVYDEKDRENFFSHFPSSD